MKNKNNGDFISSLIYFVKIEKIYPISFKENDSVKVGIKLA